MKTLNEVIKIVGLTRRMIQEYERTGLAATPITKNKYGHLLYGDKEIERLSQIRFYRELGYDKSKIRKILDDPHHNKIEALREEIEALDRKKAKLEAMMQNEEVAERLGIRTESMRTGIPFYTDYTEDQMIQVMNASFKSVLSGKEIVDTAEDVLTDEDYNLWWEIMEGIADLYRNKEEVSSEGVQKLVEKLHTLVSKELSESVIVFSGYNLALYNETEWIQDIDEEYGSGSGEFIFHAIRQYCIDHQQNPIDQEFVEIYENLETLCEQGYAPESMEVQDQIRKLDAFYAGNRIFTRKSQIQILINMSRYYSSDRELRLIEDEEIRKGMEFLGAAIDVYVTGLDEVYEKGYSKEEKK